MSVFMDGWHEFTVKRPSGMSATPQEIMEFLRENFAEDRILGFLREVGNAAVHEAAGDMRVTSAPKGPAEQRGWRGGADWIDPAKDGGPYPSKLLCFRHGNEDGLNMQPCKGTPWCGPVKWKNEG